MSARDQIAIATVLADRGWGKAPQYVVIEDDEYDNSSPEIVGFSEEFERAMEELREQRLRREEEQGSDS